MNVKDLVTYLRKNLLDDTGGQGVDWSNYSDTTFDTTQLRWTNEELVSNINEAIKQVYRRTHPVKDLLSLNVASNLITTGTTLSTNTIQVSSTTLGASPNLFTIEAGVTITGPGVPDGTVVQSLSGNVITTSTPISSGFTGSYTFFFPKSNVYSLPYSTLRLIGVRRSDGKELLEVSLSELWENKNMNIAQGQISRFAPDDIGNTIRVFPYPTTPDTLSILIYRLPLSDLVWTGTSADSTSYPELRDEFHVPMLFYAAHLCYLKDEANTLDPQRAKSFLDMFDREFPFLSAYSSIRKRRTANRPVRYGGYGEGSARNNGTYRSYNNRT